MPNNISNLTQETKNTVITNNVIISPFKSKEELIEIYKSFKQDLKDFEKSNNTFAKIATLHQIAIVQAILLSLK